MSRNREEKQGKEVRIGDGKARRSRSVVRLRGAMGNREINAVVRNWKMINIDFDRQQILV